MSLTDDQILKIVENSVWYPSGDNCQPWTMSWDGKWLHILYNSIRAEHPLNVGGMASQLSLGCLIETLSLSASNFGYRTKVEYNSFSEKPDSCWARVEFTSTERPKDSLAKFITLRTTDRRIYYNGDLPIGSIENAVNSGYDMEPAQFHFTEKIDSELTDYILNSEKLMMDHAGLFPKILEWTRFTKYELESSRDGLSLKNMGVRFWEVPLLQAIRKFPLLLRTLKWLITPRHILRVEEQLKSSAGLVCVSLPRGQIQSGPQAGRMMTRIWLALTEQKYGVQPLTIGSTLVFCAKAQLLNEVLTPHWIKFFENGEDILRRHFKIPTDQVPVWMIRTGQSLPLPEDRRTLRRPAESVLRIQKSDM